MMPSNRITNKRHATIRVSLCDELNLRTGNVVDLERTVVDGEQV
jgi:hypothetical protein